MSTASARTPKLGVQAATKVYQTGSGDLLALDRCSLDVQPNEIVSIVGPSGCGKTTLLWSMSGLHRLTGGAILLDGKEVTGPRPEIGIVFQEANLLPWRNLDANINFPFEIKGEKPDRAWIAHLLHRVGLDGFGGKFPRELSGGMQQRAAIVRALALKPSVLLMDEPFGALDSFTREEMNRLVEEIWLDTKTTIVFITHSIEEAIFLSDRVVVLTTRPGRVAKIYDVPFARPRSLEIMATKEVFDLTNRIKMDIVGERRPQAQEQPEHKSAEIVRIRP
ncbi:MAG: ATP-binding cassette domain-containing protein [Mesorhizobium sp.]|uniref:ABC transporter ATP-binding protein n=1 Tax=unclassified Mesorhizobium TaxID=325217 RepID=UPI000F75F8E5|nr:MULTISPECIES: ABC transporter ATP-binding protein [unclassified Mesorhizobium]RVC62324.1 ATP-binding cassette domain-containing protein [Mesorhizobium sp. M00.F.Ca.ET.038.03.1.1]RVC75920.1 ATP-binding cassette domain-containing protein [Mesorhizobium sp. M2A.F.Ca.ET.046.02.1.1]AZO36747.1 ABC transporter ATP-binding protein [Mesorhizobium sp. M2A.F.Ca.ET.046.03.2.1]RWB48000.1 MAG: ATP-binding cassette domain-containing protein [Mesorhizobium sp.]RWE18604.1 MAG: ATP-binding cassette domain-co